MRRVAQHGWQERENDFGVLRILRELQMTAHRRALRLPSFPREGRRRVRRTRDHARRRQ